MHPDLAQHLHTPECNRLIEAFKQCHTEHPVRMYMGYCNDMEQAVNRCLKQERKERQRLNMLKAKAVQEKIIEKQKTSTFIPPK